MSINIIFISLSFFIDRQYLQANNISGTVSSKEYYSPQLDGGVY